MVKGFKKQVFYILAACIVLAMAITSYGENKNYKIIINQKELITSNQPFNWGGRIFVPMRDIFEALDAKVEWDPKTRKITAKKQMILLN